MGLPLWMVSAGEALGIMPWCFGINLLQLFLSIVNKGALTALLPEHKWMFSYGFLFSPHFPSSALSLLLGWLLEQRSRRWGMLLLESMSRGCGSSASATGITWFSEPCWECGSSLWGTKGTGCSETWFFHVVCWLCSFRICSGLFKHWWFCSKPWVSNKFPTEPPNKLPRSANSICHGRV